MLAVGVPAGCAFTTFFDMKEFFPGTPFGLYEVPLKGIDGRGFWGLQAVLFPVETIKTFVNSTVPAELSKTLQSHSDMVLVKTLEPVFSHYASHIPCLVEHVGANASSIWKFQDHAINRRATNFTSVAFDAMTLPKFV
jgi:hypothetical protein